MHEVTHNEAQDDWFRAGLHCENDRAGGRLHQAMVPCSYRYKSQLGSALSLGFGRLKANMTEVEKVVEID